ncbi:MAG: LysR family transcriptional regulator ArgP [Motiliproteus sp.]
MLDYRQLQALASVIEAQSFDKAARRLHLTQSAVSQRVKQLEESLGQLLIIRSQPLRPTDAGQQLLRHYRQISLLQSELLESLGDAKAEGFTKLAIGLNADSLATWFLDAIDPLMQQSPILLELRIDDQDQTHHFLRQGKVIGCISASDQPMQGTNCTPLGITRYRALASAEFIARYFTDTRTGHTGQHHDIDPQRFLQAPSIEFNQKDELQDRYLATVFGIEGDYPRHRVPSPHGFLDFMLRGYGWGMVPDQQSQSLIDQGLLYEISPGNSLSVPLYWHSWNLTTELSRRLSESLVRYCRQQLEPIPDS